MPLVKCSYCSNIVYRKPHKLKKQTVVKCTKDCLKVKSKFNIELQLENEVWKEVEEFKGYLQVSNLGRIKSLSRKMKNNNTMKETILALKKKKNGYLEIGVRVDGTRYWRLAHRLVAFSFVPNPNNYEYVNHINGNKEDNRPENLEWCTAKHNINHAFSTGLVPKKKGRDKLSPDEVREIRNSDLSTYKLEKLYPVKSGQIGKIKNRQSWKNIPDLH